MVNTPTSVPSRANPCAAIRSIASQTARIRQGGQREPRSPSPAGREDMPSPRGETHGLRGACEAGVMPEIRSAACPNGHLNGEANRHLISAVCEWPSAIRTHVARPRPCGGRCGLTPRQSGRAGDRGSSRFPAPFPVRANPCQETRFDGQISEPKKRSREHTAARPGDFCVCEEHWPRGPPLHNMKDALVRRQVKSPGQSGKQFRLRHSNSAGIT